MRVESKLRDNPEIFHFQYARQQAVATLPPPPIHPDQLSESPTNQDEEEIVEDSIVEETRPADNQVMFGDQGFSLLTCT
jgi:hypothetical protein